MRDIEMTISSVVRKDRKERIFVGFYDKSAGKEAEAVIPGFIFIKNKGFSEEELKALKIYLEEEQSDILKKARTVNPLDGFTGK